MSNGKSRLDKEALAKHIRAVRFGTEQEAKVAKSLALKEAEPFIRYVVNKAYMSLRGTSYSKEDALTDGQIGFINALHRADPENLALHYFYIYIQSAVKEGFASQLLPVYAPISRRWDYWKYRTSRSSLIQENSQEPSDEEILKKTKEVTKRALTSDQLGDVKTLFPDTSEIPYWVPAEQGDIIEKRAFYAALYEASQFVGKPMELLGWLGLADHMGRKLSPTHMEIYRRELEKHGYSAESVL